MSKFKSGIVLKDRVFCPLDYDSHKEMIAELKLDDKTSKPEFVRVEIIPIDNNIFNHNMDNWKLKIDQDFKPDWFSEEFAEAEMKTALKGVFEERFITKGAIDKIYKGRWYLGGSAQVENISGRSICCFAADTAKYKIIKENGIAILYYKKILKLLWQIKK